MGAKDPIVRHKHSSLYENQLWFNFEPDTKQCESSEWGGPAAVRPLPRPCVTSNNIGFSMYHNLQWLKQKCTPSIEKLDKNAGKGRPKGTFLPEFTYLK